MRSMRATWPWLGVLTNSCAQLEGRMGRRYNMKGNNYNRPSSGKICLIRVQHICNLPNTVPQSYLLG